MKEEQAFLNLIIRSVIKGERISCRPQISWEKLFKLANKHSLLVLTYASLKNNGYLEANHLKKPVYKLMIKATSLDSDIAFVLEKLRINGIKCVPIKGYNIKKLYPNPDMRFLLDFDCLVKEKDYKKIKKIFLKEGYTYGGKTVKHLEMFSPSGNLIEFHSRLFDRFLDDDFTQEILNCENGKLTAEQEYIISLAHLASHFVSGGVGVRNIIDLYLQNKKITDREGLNKKLIRYGLMDFEQSFNKLTLDLFEGETGSEWSSELMDYVYKSDYLGGQDKKQLFSTAIRYRGDLKKAKRSSFWRKIFPCFSDMVGIYPSLQKCPLLLPIYHVRRFFAIVFTRRKNLTEFKKTNSYTEQDVIKVNKILNNLGLIKK